MAKVIVIGAGKIGAMLVSLLKMYRHEVVAQATRHQIRFSGHPGVHVHDIGDADEIIRLLSPVADEVEAVMIAIPNTGKGHDELKYMGTFRNKRLITCAKAAHAYHYPKIHTLFGSIGRRAVVGGGTDMLEVLRRRQLQNEDLLLDTVVNGTLNHIWSSVQSGSSPIGAISDAKALGYAEPGSTDHVAIVTENSMTCA